LNTKIGIVYHSITGTTELLAQAIARGVKSVEDCDSLVVRIEDSHIVNGRYLEPDTFNQLNDAAALIFGSPTFMGGVSAQFKSFADASSDFWEDQIWVNKVAAGFTIGSSFSGDQLSTIQYLAVLAAQHGMLWCGLDLPNDAKFKNLNRLGAQSGLIACTGKADEVDSADIDTAQYFGHRVATLALRLHR